MKFNLHRWREERQIIKHERALYTQIRSEGVEILEILDGALEVAPEYDVVPPHQLNTILA